MALGATALASTRDQSFLNSFGNPPPLIRPDVGENSGVSHTGLNYAERMAAIHQQSHSQDYIKDNPEIAKSYVIAPTNQGQRAAVASRMSMMYDPRNSPSRSQFMSGYTTPVQVFASRQSWVGGEGGQVKSGSRLRQPSSKAVSPFSSLPIPTRMPWDL